MPEGLIKCILRPIDHFLLLKRTEFTPSDERKYAIFGVITNYKKITNKGIRIVLS